MKKFLAIALTLVLTLALAVPAFAATETNNGTQDTTIDVKAIYTTAETTPDVVSVDLEWGAMEFTYHVGTTNKWNPSDHSYEKVSDSGSWKASGNTVKATNHSNIDVTVSFAFASTVTGVTGSFDITAPETLDAGVVGGYNTADSVTATLTLDGTLPSSQTTMGKVGTITVSIGK